MLKLYKRSPVVMEGVEFVYTQECIEYIRYWSGYMIGKVNKERHPTAKGEMELLTLEDGEYLKVKHIATEGDIIMKGVNGEIWAVKPDIHKQTYEEYKPSRRELCMSADIAVFAREDHFSRQAGK